MPQGWTVVPDPKAPPSAPGWSRVPDNASADPGVLRGVADTTVMPLINLFKDAATSSAPESLMVLLPAKVIAGIGKSHLEQLQKSWTAFREGRVSEGMGHLTAAALPVVGPMAAKAGEDLAAGKPRYAFGEALGLVAPFVARAVPKVKLTPGLTPANPLEAEAVAFGQRNRVPMDAATATGNRFVRGVQKLADESMGGSVVAEKAQQAQAQGLATVGEQLAAKGHPLPITPEQAGAGTSAAVKQTAQQFNVAAHAAYGRLRALEAATPEAFFIDLRPTRDALSPLYKQLKREAELVPLMGDKARALTALDRLMRGYEAPETLSVVDSALGDLKSLARSDMPEFKTAGQRIAADVVTALDRQVQQAALRAGTDAHKALLEGRQATVSKYATLDVLDKLNTEPVKTFRALTAQKDGGIGLLRSVAKEAPTELPKIGRAFLDDLLNTATAKGGFQHADKIAADWAKLGPQTKLLLFKDPAYVADLNKFFTLAKAIATNPNPSGTALTMWKGGELAAYTVNVPTAAAYSAATTGLSSLLHSPAGVQLLTKGLSIPISNKAAATAWAGEVAAFTRAAQPTRAAERPTPTPATTGRR